MQKLFHRIVTFLFCLLLCVQFFAAAPGEDVEDKITEFMNERGLNASNFSVSYFNLVSGESYAFNADVYRPVGKLRFLPTHMYYYEEETKGTFEPVLEDEPVFTIDGMSLEECRYYSIILSEDTVSEKMQAQIGSSTQYLELINNCYGMQELDSLPGEYWEKQSLSVEFLMNCIQIIATRPERFNGMMSNYRMVQKADAFANGSIAYPIVQIRGEEDGYITAIAEISAPQNFLVVASVKATADGDEVLGDLCKTLCNYVLESMGETVEEQTTAPTHSGSPNYYIGQDRMEKDNTLSRWLFITFAIAGALAAVAVVIHLIWKSKHRQY